MNRKSLLFNLLFILPFCANAQQSAYIQYNTNDGLAQSQVRTICQDDQGYIWFGTVGGLSRFDGFEFTNYSTRDGIPANQINCLLQGENYLWIGSTGSLCKKTGLGFESIPMPEGFASAKISDMVEDSEGNLWIALTNRGLLKFDGKTFTPFGVDSGLTDLYVRSIAMAPNGNLWIGTREGIYILSGGKIKAAPSKILQRPSVSDILFKADGSVVITSFGMGFFLVKDNRIERYTVKEGLPSSHIRCAVELPNGELWLGAKEGLIRFQNSKIKVFREKAGLPYSNIKSLAVDRGGNLWIGTDGQGVLMQAGRSFISYTVHDGLHSDLIMDICQTDTGSLVFGSYDSGLSVFNGTVFSPYPYNSALPSLTTWVLQADNQGALWVGTSDGLFREKNGKIMVLNEADGLPGSRITALAKAENGFWVGAENGFARVGLDGSIQKVFNHATGFGGERIRSLIDTKNGLWIGAEGSVFNYYKNEFKKIRIDSTEEKPVYCLVEDAFSYVWVGTSSGLYVLNPASFSLRLVSIGSQYSARNINFMTTLPDSTLLIGTNNGVYRLQVAAFHRGGELKSKHYTNYEGLQGSETNQNAVFAADDVVWFGTTSGAVKFDPNRDPFSKEVAPELNLSNVQLFLQDVDWTDRADSVSPKTGFPKNLVLPYNQNYLTFYYTGIYLSNPEKVRYRYKLDGADENWFGPTANRSVTYAYLPHGEYSFRIEAYSIDEPELMSALHFDFTITPPFYLTPWFFVIVAFFIIGLLYAIYLNQIKKEHRKRATLQLEFQSRLMELESQSLNSSMNRHFIFNALNSIQYYINMQDRKSANRYLTSFAQLIRKNLDSSQKNKTTLSEELRRLELYLSLEQMRFQGKFTFTIHIAEGVQIDSVELPSMMLQPFLENSIWHGILPAEKAGVIKICINQNSEALSIEIIDNGIGYDTSLLRKENDSEGHISKGMEITQNRIELYRKMTGLSYQIIGPQEIVDQSGVVLGTSVKIVVPK